MPFSCAKRVYIARIRSWISAPCRPAWSKSARSRAKNSPIASRTPLVNGLSSMRWRVRAAFCAQRREADDVEEVVRVLREHRAQRRVAREPALEQLLLFLDARHHVLDDVLVLAAQRDQLGELLARCPTTRASRIARIDAASARISALRRRADEVALRGNQLARQRMLEHRQAASRRAARRRR